MKKIILLFLLASCTNNVNLNLIDKTFDFDKDLSFIEFKKLLKEYNAQEPYPELER